MPKREEIYLPLSASMSVYEDARFRFLGYRPAKGANMATIIGHAEVCKREELRESSFSVLTGVSVDFVDLQDMVWAADGAMRLKVYNLTDKEKLAFFKEEQRFFELFEDARLQWCWEFFWCMKFWGMPESMYRLYWQVSGGTPSWWPTDVPLQQMLTYARSRILLERERAAKKTVRPLTA